MFGILGEIVNKVIRIKPDCVECYNRAISYSDCGDNEAAIEAFREAIRIDPKFSESYCQLSLVYSDMGRKQESIELLREGIKAVSDKEDLSWMYYVLGSIYGGCGKWQEMIESLKQCVSMDSDFSRNVQANRNYLLGIAYHALGLSYSRNSRYQEAIEAFKECIRINPDNVEAHLNLGIAFITMEDKKAALQQYTILKTLDTEQANKLFDRIYK